jgi:hypothetical protein
MKNKIRTITFAMFGLVLFSPKLSLAMPEITGVSGTVSQGQTLTITGLNLVQENTTAWLPFFSQNPNAHGFEGSNPSSDGYDFQTMGSGSVAEYQSSIKLSGAKAARFHVEGEFCCTGFPNQFGARGNIYIGTANTQTFWTRHYIRTRLNAGRWPESNKNSWYATSGGSPYVFTLRPQANNIWLWRTEGTYVPMPYSNYEHGRWYCIEEKVTGGPNGTYEIYVDGELLHVMTPTDGGFVSTQWYEFGMVNGWSTSSNPDMDVDTFLDNYAISSSRIFPSSKLEVSDTADYATATKVYQAPIMLSDTSIQITADLTGLGAGPYYLWVTNNRQERSAAYNLSGGGDVTPPVISSPLPSGEQAYGTTSVTLQVTTNEAATCRYHTSDVAYASMGSTFGSTGGTTHQQTGFSVSNGQSYTRYVRCIDGSGNASTASTAINFSVAASAPTANLLFSESFEDASWAARGWYDNTSHGTIVSGGQSGNALQWAWTSGQQRPANGATVRHLFSETDEMYVTFYQKLGVTWRGSQQTYHPHLFFFVTDQDNEWVGYAYTNLTTYIEHLSDIGSPYNTKMQLAVQDSALINSSQGTPPNNLVGVTENRSVAGCNGTLGDAGTSIDCYNDGDWNNFRFWKDTSNLTKDQWQLIAVHKKMNSVVGGVAQADGILKLWVDGSLRINITNAVYRTGQQPTKRWNQIGLGPYIGSNSPIDQTMWIDELRIYDGVPGGDTTPPSTPTNLTTTAVSTSQINLSWTASTDNVGVAGYDIRRCSGSGCTPSSIVHNTTGTGTTWNNTGLSASTIYRYDVRARDAVPNYSSYSTIAQATTQTPADTTPPSVTIATADPSNIITDSLTVTGSASDAVGVSGCKWRRTSAPDADNGTACTGTTSFSCETSGYAEGANTLYVGCYDAAGNYGSDSITVNLDSSVPGDMVLSALLPTSGTKLARTATTTTIGVTTNVAATCRWGNSPNLLWANLVAYTTTGGTTHSSALAVVAGGVYQVCSRCYNAVAELFSSDSCTNFSVTPKPKFRVGR